MRGFETYCRDETDPIELSGGSDFVADYWNWHLMLTGSGRGQNFRLIEALSAPTLEKHYNRLVQISAELERTNCVYYYSTDLVQH